MKANELRIGNLIDYNGIHCTVEVINGEVDEVYILGDSFYYGVNIKEIEPILLTKEWLLKFGFYNSNNEYSLSNGFFYICFKFYKNGNKKLWINSDCVKYLKNEMMFINSVHQLQNLYFALTYEELEIVL